MTSQDYISHVDSCIERALRHESFIDASILDIKGFSTGIQRRLVSNLTHLPKKSPCYLEVGLYAGATFCAAMNNNKFVVACGVENRSQPFGDSEVFAELDRNVKKYACQHGYVLDGDFFTLDKDDEIPYNIDIFYFDGEHSFASQAKALPHAFDHLADTFLFMVDDYAWEPVHEGTNAGFEEIGERVNIVKKWILTDGIPDGPNWHNDVAIFLCEKV